MTLGLGFLALICSIAFVLASTEPCPDGQFKAGFIDDCVHCPQNPKRSCEAEGDDSESCKISCVKGKQANIER